MARWRTLERKLRQIAPDPALLCRIDGAGGETYGFGMREEDRLVVTVLFAIMLLSAASFAAAFFLY